MLEISYVCFTLCRNNVFQSRAGFIYYSLPLCLCTGKVATLAVVADTRVLMMEQSMYKQDRLVKA